MATSYALECDDESRALRTLFDAFGTVCTLEDIASAFCKAGRDVCKAGDILYQLQESSTSGVSNTQNSEKFPKFEEQLDEDCSTNLGKKSLGTKHKKLSASVGSISSVLGKQYANGVSSRRNRIIGTIKPPKIEINEPLTVETDFEAFVPDSVRTNDSINDKDVEEFLFSMLGDGFKLSRDVIRDVLARCGYDMKKPGVTKPVASDSRIGVLTDLRTIDAQSMDELLEISASTFEKGKVVEFDGLEEPQSTGTGSKTDNCFLQDSYLDSSSGVREMPRHSSMEEKNANLPAEVLHSLFNVPERLEEQPKTKRLEIGHNRTRVIGQKPITKPLMDNVLSSTANLSLKQVLCEGPVTEEDDDYQIFRRAAKQHWDSMKQYYKAAVDAFTEGDSEKIRYHLEQGKYHTEKAREANEKSYNMLSEPRNSSEKGEIALDLQASRAKDALDLVQLFLKSLADIPTFRYLKIVIGPEREGSKTGKRRRRVLKLLENESIKWSEDADNLGTIYVQLDQVNPNKLSFVNND